MNIRLIRLKRSLWGAIAALAMVSSTEAQPAATNAWKPIIFSAPAENEISSNPISPSTQPLAPADFRGLFQDAPPVSLFNDFGPAPVPNAGGRIPNPSKDHQDWIFMTPAEIMGVSAEQLLPKQERDAKNDQKSLTPLERYLERQNSSGNFNAGLADSPGRSRNFWGQESGQTNSDDNSSDLLGSSPDDLQSAPISGQFTNIASGNIMSASPTTDSVWSKLFGTPASQPTPSATTLAQQQMELNQFQQLLNPASVPVTTATLAPDNTTAFKPQNIALPQPGSIQPLVNPMGASFAPLNSGIGEPAVLTPLPTATRQAGIPAVTTPSWAPQPAPWMSQNPQPFAIPQRKF
jgi:hypothetical protein